jgi:hypothetical protein
MPLEPVGIEPVGIEAVGIEAAGIENHSPSRSHSRSRSRYWGDSFTPCRTGNSSGVVPAR